MKKGLYIAFNSFLLLEFLSIREDFKEIIWDVSISKEYNKLIGFETMQKTIKNCIKLRVFSEEKDFYQLHNLEYDLIVCPSAIDNKTAKIIRNIYYKDIIYIEEGMSDYTGAVSTLDFPDLFYGKIKYLNNTDNASLSEKFKEIRKINIKETDLKLFKEIYKKEFLALKNLPYIDLIFFTDPLDIDFNIPEYKEVIIKYLEENYEGKNILIKQHPRDFNIYDSNKYKTYYAPRDICGQIIEKDYNVEKIFTFPSTVILSIEDISKTTILKFENLNSQMYLDLFNEKFISKFKLISI